MSEKIPSETLNEKLFALDDWALSDEGLSLYKVYKFKDFKNAWAFMSKIADLAEDMNHHPDWSNVYNRVEINLTTHDAGGITQKDLDMAKAIDDLNAT